VGSRISHLCFHHQPGGLFDLGCACVVRKEAGATTGEHGAKARESERKREIERDGERERECVRERGRRERGRERGTQRERVGERGAKA